MHFSKTGSCPRCGAAIWSPQTWSKTDIPPPSTYSCLCFGEDKSKIILPTPSNAQVIASLGEKILDLEKKVSKLEELLADTRNTGLTRPKGILRG